MRKGTSCEQVSHTVNLIWERADIAIYEKSILNIIHYILKLNLIFWKVDRKGCILLLMSRNDEVSCLILRSTKQIYSRLCWNIEVVKIMKLNWIKYFFYEGGRHTNNGTHTELITFTLLLIMWFFWSERCMLSIIGHRRQQPLDEVEDLHTNIWVGTLHWVDSSEVVEFSQHVYCFFYKHYDDWQTMFVVFPCGRATHERDGGSSNTVFKNRANFVLFLTSVGWVNQHGVLRVVRVPRGWKCSLIMYHSAYS